jgi:ATP-binding cassette subfamily C protein
MLFIIICSGFLFIDAFATFAAVFYFGMVAFIIQYFVGSLMTRASETQAKSTVLANSAISDLLSVFRELLVLGKRQKYIDNIYRARLAAADSSASTYYLSGMPRYIIEAALLVGVALFIFVQVLSGDLVQSAGTIGAFLAGGFRLTAALLPLQNSVLSIISAIPTASRAHDVLSQERVIKKTAEFVVDPDASSAINPDPITVKFEKVSFTYPGASAPALKEISFGIEPGSQVALMGPSGAGKSTIADLLCLVLTPSSGTITRFAGGATQEKSSGKVRVSYVPQKPGLVSGTIAENVALAQNVEDINRNQVVEAMKLAHLSTLLEELPQGIDTQLGKLQDGLSGGQMQRLGLARALYSKPGLLVMDEATSALDAESESEIQKALQEMNGRVTVVLIAHRLNTIQHADNVFLIEDGTIKDSGKFKELVARNPNVEKVVDLMRVEKD